MNNGSAVATVPIATRTQPMTSRTRPTSLRWTAASPSASTGLIEDGRLAALHAASRAAPMPISSAATSGIGLIESSKSAGTTPMAAKALLRPWLTAMPSRLPATPATAETTSVSRPIILRICRGVAPTARSRANSRRRCSTVSASVLATTKIATRTA